MAYHRRPVIALLAVLACFLLAVPGRAERRPYPASYDSTVVPAAPELLAGLELLSAAPLPFFDDMENGPGDWTATGLFSLVTNPQLLRVSSEIVPRLVILPDDGALPAAHSGAGAWWFGEAETGTFLGADFDRGQWDQSGGTSTQAHSGSAISPPIDLTGASSTALSFFSWWEIEGVDVNAFDLMFVEISTDGGSSFATLARLNPIDDVDGLSYIPYSSGGLGVSGQWQHYVFDLSAFAGNVVQIRFRFETVDHLFNGFRGWFIDDVLVSGTTFSAPVVTAIVPPAGVPGTLVSIEGEHFLVGATVRFGEVDATAVVAGSGLIRAAAPGLAEGVYDVTVTNMDGQSVTVADGFTIVATPPPDVQAIAPTGQVLGQLTAVEISGTAFQPGSVAFIGGVPLADLFVPSSTTIQGTISGLPIGSHNVSVVNPDGQGDVLVNSFAVEFIPVGGRELTFPEVEAEEGSVLTVSGALDDFPNAAIGRVELVIGYDPAIVQLVDIQPGPALPGFTTSQLAVGDGQVSVTFTGLPPGTAGGELVQMALAGVGLGISPLTWQSVVFNGEVGQPHVLDHGSVSFYAVGGAPQVSMTTQLPDTEDRVGPYVVTSEVLDDGLVAAVDLWWRLSGEGGIHRVGMTRIGGMGTVSGRVTDGSAGIEGARLVFRDLTGAVQAEQYSMPDGLFAAALPSGSGMVEVSAPGFVPTTLTYEVVAGADVSLGVIQLSPVSEELGSLVGTIRDAVTGAGIDGALVRLRAGLGQTYGPVLAETVSSDGGSYQIELLQAGGYTLEVNLTGYITGYQDAIVVGGLARTQDVTISPQLAGDEIRIVLTWGENEPAPNDLDAHLTGPIPGTEDRFQVAFYAPGSLTGPPYAALDVDDTYYAGPETITIVQLQPGTYRYSVHNYTDYTVGSRLSHDSQAQVRVFRGSYLEATFQVPAGQEGTVWTVFELDGQTGAITPVNGFYSAGALEVLAESEGPGPAKPYAGLLQSLAQPMADMGLYQGAIPGQAGGSVVEYYVEAVDDQGLHGREPADAPASTFSFSVLAPPSLRVNLTGIDAAGFPEIAFTMTVVDALNQPVTGLTALQVVAQEDGVPVYLSSFEETSTGSGSKADIVFIFDDTGSMSDEIATLQAQLNAFATNLGSSGVDFGLGLVTYKDDVTVRQGGLLTAVVEDFQNLVNGLSASGGDDTPENALDAIGAGLEQIQFRPGAQRILILVTDAPFQTPESPGDAGTVAWSYAQVLAGLQDRLATLHVVGPSSTGGYDNPYGDLPSLPLASGGSYYQITEDFSSIINSLQTVISSTYAGRYTTPQPGRDGRARQLRVEVLHAGTMGMDNGMYSAPASGTPLWALSVHVSTQDGIEGTVTMGVAQGARVGLDSWLGEEELPPRPPEFMYDFRWEVGGIDGLTLEYRGTEVLATGSVWDLALQVDGDNVPATIHWDPGMLPAEGVFRLVDRATGGLAVDVDMRRDDTYQVTDPGLALLQVRYSPAMVITYTYNLPAKWSMVSLPCEVSDPSVWAVFPNATALFRFSGAYALVNTMEPGVGYWINLPAPTQATVTGPPHPPEALQLPLPSRWSMIGPGAVPLDVPQLKTVYDMLISVFGYSSGYSLASTMDPGKAYWVNLGSAQTVDLSGAVAHAGPAKGLASFPGAPEAVGSALWVEGPGGSQVIHLGVATESIVELPPVPPAELFDARVEVGETGTWAVPAGGQGQRYRLRLQGGVDRLRWSVPQEAWGQWALQVGPLREVLVGSGTMSLPEGSQVWVEHTGGMPGAFALWPSYPNPFNPETTIGYDVPVAGTVELSVYAMTGQRVRQLVSSERAAGRYQVSWDGRDDNAAPVSSGVYLYELRAGEYRAVRKTMLLR